MDKPFFEVIDELDVILEEANEPSIDRWSLFSNEEKQALLRSLEEFVPVYAHGKLWNEVAVASMDLLSELRQEKLSPHPHL